MKRFLPALATLVTTLPAAAHPGHGTTDPNTPAHYVLEPVHAIVLVASLALMAFMLVLRARAARE